MTRDATGETLIAHNPRWLHVPGISGALNLCLVRDIFFGINLETGTASCQIVMAYKDLSEWPVTHIIRDPAIIRGLRELRTRESVWFHDGAFSADPPA